MGHPVKPLPFDSHRLCNLKSCCLMSLKKITTKKRKGCQRSAAPVRKKKEVLILDTVPEKVKLFRVIC
ncbi:hypothetical protein MUK42_17834 [Musa troglodytarum]|uniref:Uncharacterized protein n=1 Tax=Musa troglodytarum TaxID=320322 RepID=A0A9E7HZF6_9LILI|nr:hypothetical protein MUK42_17834 [Musa troglodytarum]